MKECHYTNFNFLSHWYDVSCPENNLIIDKMIQAINEMPTDGDCAERLSDSLKCVIIQDGIRLNNLQSFNWGAINSVYCFKLYMHFTMLMVKYDRKKYKHIFIDSLRRFNDYGDPLYCDIRKRSQWKFYFRQYIRLYGPFDKHIGELID